MKVEVAISNRNTNTVIWRVEKRKSETNKDCIEKTRIRELINAAYGKRGNVTMGIVSAPRH